MLPSLIALGQTTSLTHTTLDLQATYAFGLVSFVWIREVWPAIISLLSLFLLLFPNQTKPNQNQAKLVCFLFFLVCFTAGDMRMFSSIKMYAIFISYDYLGCLI